jgi:FlaA1/EpsC-like NDP-sugar epimerase
VANIFKEKKVLILGGTGTIGSALVKKILNFEPKVIRIFSRDEYKQFKMNEEFENNNKLRFLLGDVRDFERVNKAMEEVDIVFHCAALKHVPACEYNPFEAVKTNVIGTQNVINAALNNNVKRVIFTSSDKTISPTNTYGATKLLAERLVSTADYYKGSKDIIFSAVRFGNVMGSRGSVIPVIKKQISEKGYVTITDPDMTRFMMTVDQAIDLLISALRRAKGGEIFVLKMPVIKIGDLFDVVTEEYCLKKDIDISKIERKIIGLRVGEKIYEELMTYEESKTATEFEDMFAIDPLCIGTNRVYTHGRKTQIRDYSSHTETALSKEEVRELVVKEKMI